MSLAEDQIQKLIKIINEAIDNHPISKNEAIDTKQIPPEKFLKLYFDKKMILLKSLSSSRIQVALLSILTETSSILKLINPKELKFAVINRLCIFYVVAAKCVNSCKASGDVADNTVFELLLQQSRDVLSSNEYGIYTRYIQHNFALLLSAIGAHSSSAYEKIFGKLRDDFTSASKIQQATLRLCMYMPSKVSLLNDVFKQIVTFITLVTPKFYEPFCQMLTETILMALKRDVFAFVNFLNKAEDISFAKNIQETIMKWNVKGVHVGWSTILILEFLRPSLLSVVSGIGVDKEHVIFKLTKFPKMRFAKRDMAIKTLITGFRVYALSNSHQLIGNLMNRYYNDFMKYFTANSKDLKHNNDLAPYVFVDYALCILFRSPTDFKEKILPVLNKPGMWVYISKIVRRACKQASPFEIINNRKSDNFERFDIANFSVLIEPTMLLFQKVQDDPKASSCIPRIFKGFTYCPLFFRMIAFNDVANLDLIFNVIKMDETLSPQYSFLRFFDQKYADQAKIESRLIDIYYSITKFMTDFFGEVTLYKSTHFANSVPDILFQIAETLFSLFSSNTSIEDQSLIKQTLPTISLLETDAIMFLASSKEDIRLKGARIISILLEIYHLFLEFVRRTDFFDDIQFPVEEYQIIETRHNKKLTTASPYILNALRSIDILNSAHILAFSKLFQYFLALTHALDPQIQLIEEPKYVISDPTNKITDEWIGTISVMLSIQTVTYFPTIMNQLKILLKNTGDLGAIIVSAVPISIPPRYFFAIVNLSVSWISFMQNQISQAGIIEATSESSTFVSNTMHMIRGLAEQKQWTVCDSNLFGQLLRKMVAHCDMIPGEDFRLYCAQTIISIIKLLKSHNNNLQPIVRHSISKSLLSWLPTVANLSRQYTSTIHQCLALLLDDLSLLDCVDKNDPKPAEEKADAQFMLYFAAIKNRLDMKETSANDMVPVLAALLKQNLSIGVEHCISMGFDDKDTVRAAFIAAVAAVFRVPEAKISDPIELMSDDKSLGDIIFSGNWEFVEFICSCIPYSRAEAFGAAMVEGAIIRHLEYEFLDRMIGTEIRTVDECSKNTLFRGNAVPARAVGHFPRIVGAKWMTDTLRPIFEGVIEKCRKGERYQVDPSKLNLSSEESPSPSSSANSSSDKSSVISGSSNSGGNNSLEQQLEKNQKNFRDLLNLCIDKIVGARETMPEGLVREAKMIYAQVYDKYGDFATQILCGFLFLRFLLPAFSVPRLVGLPELLPPEPRQALLLVSTVLMVSTLRGRLDDKGAHLIPFNDVAARANEQFAEFFKQIVLTNISTDINTSTNTNVNTNINANANASCGFSFNEKQVTVVLHQELWPLVQQIQNATADDELSEDIKSSSKILVTHLQSMGEPVNPKKSPRRRTTLSNGSGSVKSANEAAQQFDTLMQVQFTEESLCQLQDFIIKDEKPAAVDNSTIFFVFFEKLDQIKDQRIVPFLIFKALMDDANPTATLVFILRNFDEGNIPPAPDIEVFGKMPPVSKIKRVICLETEPSYVSFIQNYPTLLNIKPHVFPDSIDTLVSLLGPISPRLPLSTLESVSPPDSVHKAQLVRSSMLYEKQIRLLQHSIIIVSSPETICSLKVTPMSVLTIMELKFDKPIASNDSLEFSLYLPKNDYRLRISNSSPLYELIVLLIRRTQALKTLSSKVKVDTSTLQWLMLNLAFVNMVNEAVVPSVLKASNDLVYATFVSFNFKHETTVYKTPSEDLPKNMVGFVQSLSEDIAKNNPEGYSGFMTEYFKVFNYVPMTARPSTFLYLKPWIPYYAADIDNHPQFTENLLKTFSECIDAAESFTKCIWSGIYTSQHAVETFLHRIFEIHKSALLLVVAGFASIDPPMVTRYFVDVLMKECIENANHEISFVCKGVAYLFANHLFDMSQLNTLIYNLLIVRLKFGNNLLIKCRCCFSNMLHAILNYSSKDVSINFTEASEAFTTCSTPNRRGFYLNSLLVSSAVQKCLKYYPDSRPISQSLFDSFSADLTKSTYVLYSASFSLMDSEDLLQFLLKLATETENDEILSSISMSLTLIDLENHSNRSCISSKLFIIAAALCLKLRSFVCADLLCKTIRELDEDHLTSTYKEQLEYIEKATGETPLPFSTEPVFAAMVVISSISDYSNQASIVDLFIECLRKKKSGNSTSDSITAAAAVLLSLKEWDNPELIKLFIDKTKEQQNEIVFLIKAVEVDTKRKLFSVMSPNVLAIMVRCLKSTTMSGTTTSANGKAGGLATWIAPHFTEAEKIEKKEMFLATKISHNQFLYLINSILKK